MTSRREHEPTQDARKPARYSMTHASPRAIPWRKRPEREELRAIYREADALLDGYACDASTDCCRFGVTGREPYVTEVELAEIRAAIAENGGHRATRKRSLEIAGERRCPMLTAAGKCSIYAARPLGCRTFFCDASLKKMGAKLPRVKLQALVRAIDALSEKAFVRGEDSRPLTQALSSHSSK